ncbi:MAG: HAD-IB family hydrolase [Actinobacteria bacterium]|jgi:HAD superfamily hydrolase (TIGR01490 family)|nr:HAD-IB family hydrolase [Actinomycetota bacterium]
MALIQKRVAFFDVDNTLLKGSTLFFLGRGMYQRGFFTKKDISAFVLANLRYRLTGKENKDEIVRFQNAACEFIKGHDVVEIEKIGQEIYEEYVSPAIWQGTVEIAQEHLAKGEEVWLVTATPVDMANLMAKRLGFTGALGTKAETRDGTYTGKMIGNLLHGREKAVAIKELSQSEGFDLKNCYAYSDSHHDIPLLEAVGSPRVINPDTLLEIRAYRDNWPVYDFRRARKLKKFIGPTAGRLAAFASLISPRRLRG